MLKVLLLISGGAIGTLARYALSGWIYTGLKTHYPWGTLAVNLVGSMLIGFFWGLWEDHTPSTNLRLFLMIGILGGFTTFSTFALESMNLMRGGETRIALLYMVVTNVLGLVMVFLGYWAAKGVFGLK